MLLGLAGSSFWLVVGVVMCRMRPRGEGAPTRGAPTGGWRRRGHPQGAPLRGRRRGGHPRGVPLGVVGVGVGAGARGGFWRSGALGNWRRVGGCGACGLAVSEHLGWPQWVQLYSVVG